MYVLSTSFKQLSSACSIFGDNLRENENCVDLLRIKIATFIFEKKNQNNKNQLYFNPFKAGKLLFMTLQLRVISLTLQVETYKKSFV